MDNVHENISDKLVLADALQEQILTFFLGEEEYGMDILSVIEIRRLEMITPLPIAPKYIEGVVNLRGTVIPIMDLRKRFQITDKKFNTPEVVIVIRHINNDKDRLMGIIVDAVSDVYLLERENVQNIPDVCLPIDESYLLGLLTIQQREIKKMIILLNTEKLFT